MPRRRFVTQKQKLQQWFTECVSLKKWYYLNNSKNNLGKKSKCKYSDDVSFRYMVL